MLLPYLIGNMDALEIADYCDSNGLSTDPVINVLVEFILKKAESDAQITQEFSGNLFEKMTEALKAVDFLGIASESKREVAPIGHKKLRPGPKERYLPVILALVKRHEPLKQSELVEKVLLVCPSAGKGAIYRAIGKAVDKRKIVALDNNFYLPR